MISSEKIQQIVRQSLIAGVVITAVCMIGVIEGFNVRDVISDRLTLGQLVLFSAPIVAGFLAVQRLGVNGLVNALIAGLLSGVMTGVPVFVLLVLTLLWPGMREAFINVSPTLIGIITFGQEAILAGGAQLVLLFTGLGLLGALFAMVPAALRRATLIGLGWTFGIGTMAEIIINILRQRMSSAAVGRVFGSSGLQLNAFLILLIAIIAASYGWHRFGKAQSARMRSRMSPGQLTVQRRISGGLLVLLLLILPSILGVYLTEIMNNVGLYILMGLGLNIAIGLAGLLDLGYVTNFAVGAYVMALLTSSSEYGLENPVPFWVAVPICIVAAMITGFVLALPVLRMRGDYLAIATLGFGEIIARLARSDALKPVIGGAQGILQIPKAQIGGALGQGMATILTPINNFLERFSLGVLGAKDGVVVFGTPPQLFYLLILACLLMLVISRRLNNSRTGRRWMAMREDEDVANAVGINTTNAKVIAFTLSAASGGLAGAIFAAKLGSIFPNSFQLLISVNVLSLIIVGGLGSIPGVIVGAFALIGVPELLREFAEFRLLLYGIALIVMMLVRPEGLWPSDVRRRELRGGEDPPPGVDGQEAVAVSAD